MGFFNKIWSGLDFWDKEENQGQREQYAREDEEERRRRAREAALRSQSPQQPTFTSPQQNFDFTNPLAKVGSQSQFGQQDPMALLQKNQTVAPIDKRSKGEKEIDALTEQHLARAVDEEKSRTSWFDRQFTDRNWADRAKVAARNRAVREYQEKHGFNRQPEVKEAFQQSRQELDEASKGGGSKLLAPVLSVGRVGTGLVEGGAGLYDLLTPGEGQNRLTKSSVEKAKEIDELARDLDIEGLYKGGNVPLEIATYFSPGLLTKAGKVGNLTSKLSTKADDILKLGSKFPKLRKFGSEAIDEFLDPRNLEMEARLTGRYLGQDSAHGEDISGGNVAENAAQSVVGAFLPPFARRALKKFRGNRGEIDAATAGTAGAANRLLNQGDEVVEEGIRKVGPEDAPDIPGTATKDIDPNAPSVTVEEGVKSTNLAKNPEEAIPPPPPPAVVPPARAPLPGSQSSIPNPADPIALAKAGDSAVTQPPPMANFNEAVNGSLQKVDTPQAPPQITPEQTALDLNQQAAQGDLRVGTDVDAAGNPVLISDADAQRKLAEQGVVPERGGSPVATEEAARQADIEQAAREEVNLEGAAAPRTREQVTARISDEDLRADVLETFPEKSTINLEETQQAARQKVNQLSDEQLVARFGGDVVVDSPEGFFTAIDSIRRLEQIGTPEANSAIQRAVDAVAEFSSKSGQNLRTTQILFEDMPTTMKVDYLMNKLSKAGADLDDVQRTQLMNLIQGADDATEGLRSLEGRAQELLDSGLINNKSMPPEIRGQVKELVQQIDQARNAKELASGRAWQDFQSHLPKGPLGKRISDVGRTLMLSAPTGRIFDILSTTMTSADDLATRGVSNLIGKILNKVPGMAPGKFTSTVGSPRKLVKGFREGATRTRKAFKGEDYVEDFLGAAKRATRGEVNTGGGKFRQFVRSAVEAPTNLTRGLREEELYRQGVQEAAQQGLKGKAAKTYANLRASIPNDKQLRTATQNHLKANMLHDNKISRTLNQLADALDKKGKGFGAVFIRNQVAPFTSWLGGNLQRTLTDKNVLWNTGSIIKNAFKGNGQGVIDDIAKLTVNVAEGFAAGMLLTKAGVITTTDANGDSYGGLYLHIGNRYVPVAVAGTVAAPLIWGNAVYQAQEASAEGKNPTEAFVNALTGNLVKNTGVASTFGGENNLQSTISQLGGEKPNAADAATRFGANLGGQYIPGFTGDINAVLDNPKLPFGIDNPLSLNPTGEAAQTKVTYENPETGRDKTDVQATEFNKLKSRIPIVSQSLPRKEGTAARDLLDRSLKGNRETGTQVEEREEAKTKEGIEKDRIERGVPKTDDGILAKVEKGDWDSAIEGYKWKMERGLEDGEMSKKTETGIKDEIKRIEITRDGDYPTEIVDLYSDTSLTEWRDMGDPDSDDYDLETFKMLTEYDEKHAKAGVSRYAGDHSKTRYYSKDSKRGRGSGRGKKGPRFATDIATQDARGYTFQPIKAKSANFAPSVSAIPTIARVPNYDRSKLKKISVTKGGRA